MADKRLVWRESLYAGLAAGIVFGVVQLISFALVDPLEPVRLAASVFLGQDALANRTAGPLLVGLVVHLALSSLFGLWYGALGLRLSPASRRSWGFQAGLGVLYGLAVWAVNVQLIARALYPWFLDVPQFAQALLHAFAFGLPLALAYEVAERRVETPETATQRV